MDNKISNRQIAFVVFNAIIGYGILSLPKEIAENAGTGGWVSVVIATIAVALVSFLYIYLGLTYKEKTVYEYSQCLVGKFVTNLFIVLYIIHFFLMLTLISRSSAEYIKLSFIIKTPIWAIILAFMIVAYYAVIKRLKVISRLCEIYGLIIIVSIIFAGGFLLSQGKLVNLMPFFNESSINQYVKTFFKIFFSFLGIEVLAVMPFNKELNDKKLYKKVSLLIGIVGILYIAIFEASVSVMGVDNIKFYNNATLAAIRRVDISYLDFLSRLDGIFLMTWVMAIYTTIIICAYGVVLLLSKLLKSNSFKTISAIVIAVSFFSSLIPRNIYEIEAILKYSSYFSIFIIISIPSILSIITVVKRHAKKVR